MGFEKQNLDLVLVPGGLFIMFAYHLFFLHRCLNRPHATVIGFENNDKKAWVERIMQVQNCWSENHNINAPSTFRFSSLLSILIDTGNVSVGGTPMLKSDKLYRAKNKIILVKVTRHATLHSVRFACLKCLSQIPFGARGTLDKKDIGTALTVINANISAATYLCSVSLTLSSLIGAWLSSSSTNVFQSELIYGDTRPLTISIKYVCLLSCFLLSFFFFVQSARHFVHANYLISTPLSDIPIENVEIAVIRGSNFWSVGLRALYFALNMLLWFFGPIPMFVSSLIMVTILHYLDSNSRPLHKHQYPSSRNTNNHDQGLKMVVERRSEVGLTAQIHGRKLPQVGV